MHRYSPYSNTPTSAIHNPLSQPHHGQQMGNSNLFESLTHNPHYGMHHHHLQQHHMGPSHVRMTGSLDRTSHPKQRSHSGSSAKAAGTSGPVRRRISRACDQCNQLRTKCDGKLPCAHCV
ncbi:hypothetical protein E4U24_002447, partial [Claviceps purpurea]